MKPSPRVGQYAKGWSDAEIDAAVAKPALRVALEGTDALAHSQVLAHAIRSIFLADGQVRAVLRHLISLACGHAQAHFSTDDTYLRGLYSKHPWGKTTSPAVCLTGLAVFCCGTTRKPAVTSAVPNSISRIRYWLSIMASGLRWRRPCRTATAKNPIPKHSCMASTSPLCHRLNDFTNPLHPPVESAKAL